MKYNFRANLKQYGANIGFIDALRGIAILMVIFHHMGEIFPGADFIRLISPFGKYGVQLFFVMSAFTMCYTGLDKDAHIIEMLKFYLKRWFRIAPLYLLAIPFYYILAVIAFKINSFSITQPAGYSLPNILSNVFFVHGLYPPGNNSIVPGGWSIGCEMIFYFIFPKLLQLFKKSLWYIVVIQVLSWIAILSLLAISKSLGFKGEGGGSSFAYYFIANQMAPFLLGILLFFLWHNNTFHKILLWGAIIALFLIVFLETKSKAWLITPLCAGACSVFLAKKVSMIKNLSALVKVGRLSYSMYLSHFFFVWLTAVLYDKLNLKVESNLACFIGFIFVFILSFLTSKLTNKYLEIPFVDMGKRIIKKLPERKIVSASNLYNASNG